MLIGDLKSFAIEVHHEPVHDTFKQVFGRMCIHAGDAVLGNINEPDCMLDVTEQHLLAALSTLALPDDAKFDSLNDQDAFNFLNEILYLDEARTLQEVQGDSKHYFRYDFLTNGGESFDHTKSFIIKSGAMLRLLFTDRSDTFHAAHISQAEFSEVANLFLSWISQERHTRQGSI